LSAWSIEKHTRLWLLPSAVATLTSNAIVHLLAPYKNHIHTITADNSKEFAHHKAIAQKLQTHVYFARPYCSWERGLNENTNGFVRQYFPKKTNVTKRSIEQVKCIEHLLNSRPRKSLNFKTPNQVFLPTANYALRC
jgi:IS30 family transposase